jgi:hypothetical protein
MYVGGSCTYCSTGGRNDYCVPRPNFLCTYMSTATCGTEINGTCTGIGGNCAGGVGTTTACKPTVCNPVG